MTTPLDNLLDFDQSALKAYCERVGEKSFRATQLFRWIHHRGVGDFDGMTDLARSLRAKLAGVAEVRALSVMTEKGTIRADFADSIDANAVHGSDAAETAAIEIAFFFPGLNIYAR